MATKLSVVEQKWREEKKTHEDCKLQLKKACAKGKHYQVQASEQERNVEVYRATEKKQKDDIVRLKKMLTATKQQLELSVASNAKDSGSSTQHGKQYNHSKHSKQSKQSKQSKHGNRSPTLYSMKSTTSSPSSPTKPTPTFTSSSSSSSLSTPTGPPHVKETKSSRARAARGKAVRKYQEMR